jgi:uncharacterized membrane protein
MKRMLPLIALPILATFDVISSAGPHCPPRYTASWVTGPNCGITGYASLYGWGGNENGVIVGSYACPGGLDKAYVSYDGTTLTPLGFPVDTSQSRAMKVNIKGQICGEIGPIDSASNAFILDKGEFHILGELPGGNTSEFGGINANGIVAGSWGSTVEGTLAPFRWENGIAQDIGEDLPLPGLSRGYGISDSGLVTGYMGETMFPYDYHAYLWNNGNVTDLGLPFPDCFATEGFAVNNDGHVCGRWWRSIPAQPFFRWRGFFYDGEKMMDLGLLGNLADLVPQDLNNNDQVVGYAGSSPIFAFIWHNNTLYNLNDLIIQGDTSVIIRAAQEITDEGRIFGHGHVPGAGSQEAISLTPLPPREGDVDCDVDVDVDDLLGVINQWGPCEEGASCSADLDVDGVVGYEDLLTVIFDWDK